MEISGKSIVGEIVADNYKSASVFKANGIDFCCRGNRTLNEVCDANKLSLETLISELQSTAAASNSTEMDFKSWPLDLLADYIEKKHHAYVERQITEIKPYLAKVAKVHGDEHPELMEINELFNATANELTMHMKKEELVLFPFIRKLFSAHKSGVKLERPHFGTVNNPINMMKEDHDVEGVRFRKIAALSNNYTVPADGCNTYRVTFALLQEFENDLHLHIHLENNILFPEAIRLEALEFVD